MPAITARDVIALLALKPHPEGGHFRETFRETAPAGERAPGTSIYYLLAKGEISHWHRIDASEIWHWYAGAPLELRIAADEGETARVTLGNNLMAGERPQCVVPKGHWQSARSMADWTLAGCTVAPGFEFSGFEMAPEGWAPKPE